MTVPLSQSMMNYSVIAASFASFTVVLWMITSFITSYTESINQQQVTVMLLLNQMVIITCIGLINIMFLLFLI